MFNFLFIAIISSCTPSNKKMLERAEAYIGGTDCLANVERILKENHCPNIEVYVGEDNVVFRCQKVNRERKNLWDSWWFRVSSSIKEYSELELPAIEEHTICIDAQVRIEAYPPRED